MTPNSLKHSKIPKMFIPTFRLYGPRAFSSQSKIQKLTAFVMTLSPVSIWANLSKGDAEFFIWMKQSLNAFMVCWVTKVSSFFISESGCSLGFAFFSVKFCLKESRRRDVKGPITKACMASSSKRSTLRNSSEFNCKKMNVLSEIEYSLAWRQLWNL